LFGGYEGRFGVNETCKPFLCLERDHNTFTCIYSDPGVSTLANGEGEEGVERRREGDLFRESLARGLHLWEYTDIIRTNSSNKESNEPWKHNISASKWFRISSKVFKVFHLFQTP
jgi:hypothetical protein